MRSTLWLQFLSALFIAIAGGGIATNAFFFDREGSQANRLTATILDGELMGEPLDGVVCNQGSVVSTNATVRNIGSVPFGYTLWSTNEVGPLCGEVELTISTGSTTLYTGPLASTTVVGSALTAGDVASLTFAASLLGATDTEGTCTFDLILGANQALGGFFDREVQTHTVSRTAAECGPFVDLYLNKHISGSYEGYELSDFSYRITGENIDIIAPHDSYTPLPAGTYTIEELVPEGFVKDDWRIGWYGQCESGSDFSTTITITERQLTFGTLYCEADNQYRPDQRRSNEPDTGDDGASGSAGGGSSRSDDGGEVEKENDDADDQNDGDRRSGRSSNREPAVAGVATNATAADTPTSTTPSVAATTTTDPNDTASSSEPAVETKDDDVAEDTKEVEDGQEASDEMEDTSTSEAGEETTGESTDTTEATEPVIEKESNDKEEEVTEEAVESEPETEPELVPAPEPDITPKAETE